VAAGTDLPFIGLMVKRLQAGHHKAADAALRPLGITLVQWDVLRHLHENPGASLHDLARLTFQTDQSMGTLAGRSEARGFIERVPGPGRAVRHRLTPEGERLRAQGSAVLQEVLEESFAPLSTQERATFERLLTKLLTGGSESPV
jgi:DNA-binding MarR family transcriptional regulator